MTSTVLSDRDTSGIRTITLNRPERLNAMSVALIGDLTAALTEAGCDAATRVIILTGAGRAFCAGDDLKDHAHPKDEAAARVVVERIQQATRALSGNPKLVIGAINGWAVGGGFEWAINCDLSIWSETAKAFFPELEWGLFVTGGVTALLPAMVGLTKAREMLYLGEKYTAAELHELGLAWKVVSPDDLMPAARSVAARIATLPPQAVADMKRALDRSAHLNLESALQAETEATIRGFLDPETTKRIAEFAKS
ncbi:MAG: enoyl-CoA hydratase/isomerase family protein [Hyphomicrobiaceae bacterium]